MTSDGKRNSQHKTSRLKSKDNIETWNKNVTGRRIPKGLSGKQLKNRGAIIFYLSEMNHSRQAAQNASEFSRVIVNCVYDAPNHVAVCFFSSSLACVISFSSLCWLGILIVFLTCFWLLEGAHVITRTAQIAPRINLSVLTQLGERDGNYIASSPEFNHLLRETSWLYAFLWVILPATNALWKDLLGREI